MYREAAAFKARVAGMLARIEWVEGGCDGGDRVCASCGGIDNDYDCFGEKVAHRGHASGCALAVLLAEARA